MRDLSSYPDAHLRIFDRPAVPPPGDIESVYLIGICGTGMGSLAGLFHQAGYKVVGSDQNVYPPMSTHLRSLDVTIHQGYDYNHLDPAPDLVVVGNACRPTHPEATYARREKLVQQSFPEALAHFFIRDQRSLVVGGTHGKTTTTGLLIHLFQAANRDPGYLVGGVPQDGSENYHLGSGSRFIVEGDEYDSAYFDKQPKFLHYRPTSAIITSMELDHVDIYRNWKEYRNAFREFAASVDPNGLLVLHGDNPAVRALSRESDARIYNYGLDPHQNDISATEVDHSEKGQTFTLQIDGQSVERMTLPLNGTHNLLNALAACAIALDEGLSVENIKAGLASFKGIKRRQEVRATINDIVVVDDFAHHPTAVRTTIEATRERWPNRRVVAIFEPRSNSSRRKLFESRYASALTYADQVFLSVPPFRHNDAPDKFIDTDELSAMLTNGGTPTGVFPNADELLPPLVNTLQPGDVALIMSNGGFDNIHERLIEQLKNNR